MASHVAAPRSAARGGGHCPSPAASPCQSRICRTCRASCRTSWRRRSRRSPERTSPPPGRGLPMATIFSGARRSWRDRSKGIKLLRARLGETKVHRFGQVRSLCDELGGDSLALCNYHETRCNSHEARRRETTSIPGLDPYGQWHARKGGWVQRLKSDVRNVGRKSSRHSDIR